MEKTLRYGDFEQVNGSEVNKIIDQLEQTIKISLDLKKQIDSMNSSGVPPSGNIYKMELNDYIHEKDLIITRVPGGWLYSKMETYEGQTMVLPPVFVPMHREFSHGKNMEVVEFPEVEKAEDINLSDEARSIYNAIKIPEQCQINCQCLDEDLPIDEEDRSTFNCTIADICDCPIVISKLGEIND